MSSKIPIPLTRAQTNDIKRIPRHGIQKSQGFAVQIVESDDESPLQAEILNNNTLDTALNVCYGDYVELVDGRLGTVRYIGTPNHESNLIWFGISLSEKSGKHDGTQGGITYWQDKPKHGIFVKPKQILAIVKR